MSTCNFILQDGVPLYAFDDAAFHDPDTGEYDYIADADFTHDVAAALDAVNLELSGYADGVDTYISIELMSGYYSGYQLYVHGLDRLEETAEEIAEYVDYTPEEAAALLNGYIDFTREELARVAAAYGFSRYKVYARFNSGETWYSRVEEDPR